MSPFLSLARALRALESSEGAEEKSYVNVIGSLKDPCKEGVPMFLIGKNGEPLRPRISLLILDLQELPI